MITLSLLVMKSLKMVLSRTIRFVSKAPNCLFSPSCIANSLERMRIARPSNSYDAGSCTLLFPKDPFSIAASIILFPLMIEVVQMMICFLAIQTKWLAYNCTQ
jgi:hypothetical protein